MEIFRGISDKFEAAGKSIKEKINPPQLSQLLRSEKTFLTGVGLVGIGEYTLLGTLGFRVAESLITGTRMMENDPLAEAAIRVALVTGLSGFAIIGGILKAGMSSRQENTLVN